jgi:hypothetical protein
VTDGTSSPLPQPGWYPDHAGGTGLRWWDGTQWTDHVSAPIAAQPNSAQPYSAAGPLRNTVPATTPVGNPFIWTIVLLPIVSLVLSLLVNYGAFIDEYRSLIQQMVENPNSAPNYSAMPVLFDPAYLILVAWSYLSIAITAVFGYLDSRRLKRTGFERPFPWGWAFLPVVYIIGRSVVVHRRSGRGLAPLWVYIGLTVVGFGVGIYILSTIMSGVMSVIPDVSSFS